MSSGAQARGRRHSSFQTGAPCTGSAFKRGGAPRQQQQHAKRVAIGPVAKDLQTNIFYSSARSDLVRFLKIFR